MYNYNYNDNYLMHYGVIGMKWGVRRYQNSDGTLTNRGLSRYGSKKAYEAHSNFKQSLKKINPFKPQSTMPSINKYKTYRKEMKQHSAVMNRIEAKGSMKSRVAKTAAITGAGVALKLAAVPLATALTVAAGPAGGVAAGLIASYAGTALTSIGVTKGAAIAAGYGYKKMHEK